MSRKAFVIQVELDVQAVTCPGVWLCSNGKVSLQIYMLDSCVQTKSYKPLFPVDCDENFVFYKTFYSRHRLNDLQKELRDEFILVELIQWQSCEVGNVLATFQTTLDELLYPSTRRGSVPGVDVDLLMEPSKSFPGTIGPKIEVSTRTTIEETVCVCDRASTNTVVVNPKVLTSLDRKTPKNVCRKVCHSMGYNRRKRPFRDLRTKPPFRYRKAEESLILRKPQGDSEPFCPCSCRQSRCLNPKFDTYISSGLKKKPPAAPYKRRSRSPSPKKFCACGSGHRENCCPVCTQYECYFKVASAPTSPVRCPQKEFRDNTRSNLFEAQRCCPRVQIRRKSPGFRKEVPPDEDKHDNSSVEDCETEQESGKKACDCNDDKRSGLVEKLHRKLNNVLKNYDDHEGCDSCDCCLDAPTPQNKSRAEFYRDLQKFYGYLYEKAKNNVNRASCVPNCPGFA